MRAIRVLLVSAAVATALVAVPSTLVSVAAAVTSDAVTDPTSIDFGDQLAPPASSQTNALGTPYVLTVTYSGTPDVTLGTVAFTGAQPSWFAFKVPNVCSGKVLHKGGSCAELIEPNLPPGATGAGTAALSFPISGDATTTGASVALRITAGPAAPVTATPGPSFVDVSWGHVPTDSRGADSYVLERGASATTLAPIPGQSSVAVGPGTYHDVDITPATKYFYAVEPVVGGAPYTSNPAVSAVPWQRGGPGSYVSLTPARVLDTRTKIGGHPRPVGPNTAIHLQLSNQGGVPPSMVSAVVLNLTGIRPTAPTYLDTYPTGAGRPLASDLNLARGETRANMVTVALGLGGSVDIYNSAGSVNLVADVVGFYANSQSPVSITNGGQYQPLDEPARVDDTRVDGPGGTSAPLKSRFVETVRFAELSNVASNVKAVAVNLTAVHGGPSGYITSWSGVGNPPVASTLDFFGPGAVSNMAIVPVGPCPGDLQNFCAGFPVIKLFNGSAAPVDLIVDLVGFYDDDTLPGGLRYHPFAAPQRIADSRHRQGLPGAIGAGATSIVAAGSAADDRTVALDTNVTAIAPSSTTYLTLWPEGIAGIGQPATSNLNALAGSTIASHAIVRIGPSPDNQFNVKNANGLTNVAIDVTGTFEQLSPPG